MIQDMVDEFLKSSKATLGIPMEDVVLSQYTGKYAVIAAPIRLLSIEPGEDLSWHPGSPIQVAHGLSIIFMPYSTVHPTVHQCSSSRLQKVSPYPPAHFPHPSLLYILTALNASFSPDVLHVEQHHS